MRAFVGHDQTPSEAGLNRMRRMARKAALRPCASRRLSDSSGVSRFFTALIPTDWGEARTNASANTPAARANVFHHLKTIVLLD